MTVSIPWITGLFYIIIRLGTILLFTPIQAIRQLPVHTRLVLVFAFSILIKQYLPGNPVTTNVPLITSCLIEFANGLILATSFYAAFAVFQIAGHIIDSQMGLDSLTLFNPQERTQEPLSGNLLTMIAVLLFFGINGHLWLFKGLAFSFTIIPPGAMTLFNGFTPVIQQFGFMFSIAFLIASPMVLTLLAIDLCSAIITRNMPQINIYLLTLPFKIILGIFLLAMMLQYINPITDRVFERCFQTWQEIMS